MFEFIDYSLQIPLQIDLVLTNMQCEPGNSGIERRLLDDDFTLHTVITRKLWKRKTTFRLRL